MKRIAENLGLHDILKNEIHELRNEYERERKNRGEKNGEGNLQKRKIRMEEDERNGDTNSDNRALKRLATNRDINDMRDIVQNEKDEGKNERHGKTQNGAKQQENKAASNER